MAPSRPLVWEVPYTTVVALKRKKKEIIRYIITDTVDIKMTVRRYYGSSRRGAVVNESD